MGTRARDSQIDPVPDSPQPPAPAHVRTWRSEEDGLHLGLCPHEAQAFPAGYAQRSSHTFSVTKICQKLSRMTEQAFNKCCADYVEGVVEWSNPTQIVARQPFEVHVDLRRSALKIPQRTGQCCFICFNIRNREPFAVKVPCWRPTKARRVICEVMDDQGNILRTEYEKVNAQDTAVECDTDIYRRLKQIAFGQYGEWTRWLPFYGVTSVQEVEVLTP